jgi:hypothetical protein
LISLHLYQEEWTFCFDHSKESGIVTTGKNCFIWLIKSFFFAGSQNFEQNVFL